MEANKASILFRLQADEWGETSALLRTILEDTSRVPAVRLRALVVAFIRSECEEASVRVALSDAAPLYRDAPESKAARASGERSMRSFLREALPNATDATRRLTSEVIGTTLSAVGKSFSERPHTPTEIQRFAGATADMLCAYLESLE